ncbi:MAG TPA: hypothetical protein VMW31_01545, partial [Devosiaceae bacterium]|nr:hypothetical protein [Devosiaceae bacterium]
LTVIRNLERPGPVWAVPHDEENEGFWGGVYGLRRYGGVLVAVENAERRLNDGQDPNQIFAITARAVQVCPGARAPVPDYVAAFLKDWDTRVPVVGLHSNWDGFLEAGGLGSISVRRSDPKMIPFASPVAEGRLADEDTVVMLVGSSPPDDDTPALKWMNEHGVHVIYRHTTEDNNGCTLADYLTLNRLGDYYNLEVERGDPQTQPVLIDLLMTYLEIAPVAPAL